jgi:DNA recombination protein RmuC
MDVSLMWLVVGVLIGGVLGALTAWLVQSREIGRLRVRTAEAEGARAADRADLDAMRLQQSSAQALGDLLQPVRDSLEHLRRSTEQASRERTAAEATITTQITAVQERYQSLEAATSQIASALARGQTRGQWGEMQLEGLLEHAGLLEGTHFTRQESRVGTHRGDTAAADAQASIRPDIVVRLPGGGEILVDAKFPFDSYWQAIGTQDPQQRDELMRKHAADVLLRARELSSKRYADVSTSPDFVVMFLPLESLLSASLEADGLLLEKAFERRVILATPTTMLALLRTVAFGYQRQLMADNAEQVRAAGAEMLARLGILVEHLDGMRRGLEQAVRGYNSFVGSFDRHALRQARRLHELGVAANRDLEAPPLVETAVREPEPASLRD